MALKLKDPEARVDYAIDWRDYLGVAAIASSSWTVAPAHEGGIAIVASGHDFTRTTVRVEGGREGALYRLTNRVTLSDGQVDERSIALRVEQQ